MEPAKRTVSSVETTKSVEAAREAVSAACAKHGFGVLGVHDLKAKLRDKGVELAGECVVLEVCNPHKAKAVLEANPEVSTALPCRISVYRAPAGKTHIATLRPTELMAAFGTPELECVAREVEETLEAILADAARE